MFYYLSEGRVGRARKSARHAPSGVFLCPLGERSVSRGVGVVLVDAEAIRWIQQVDTTGTIYSVVQSRGIVLIEVNLRCSRSFGGLMPLAASGRTLCIWAL